MRDKIRKVGKDYLYSDVLVAYLDEKLKIERLKKVTSTEGRSLSKIDERRIKNSDKKKVRVLDNHVFRSIANLIYFFEFLNEHRDEFGDYNNDLAYRGIFDNDIQDLLGLRGEHVKGHKVGDEKYQTFSRLISAMVGFNMGSRRNKKNKIDSFERSRNDGLQLVKAVAEYTQRLILNLGLEKDRDLGLKIISQDMGRLQAWTSYCTSEIKLNLENPHRKISF